MENKKIRVALTHGDTNGIGYELIFKAFAEPEMFEFCTPVIYGSPKIAAYHCKALDIQGNFSIINTIGEAADNRLNLLTCFDEEVKVDLGIPTAESGAAALKALDKAMTDYRDDAYDVLVNCPVDNSNIHIEGYTFGGISKYIETCLGERNKAATLYLSDNMRMISNPRVAILALNPTEQGNEEKEIIAPAISNLAEKGVQAFGPYTAETFFENRYYDEFDGILAMHYDQGVPLLKTLATESVVKFNANLPIISTEPDCHVRFNTTGKCLVDANSLRHAIYTAIDIYRNRMNFDEPLQNPLPKLYHEKHDDGEKVRFTIPKKKHE